MPGTNKHFLLKFRKAKLWNWFRHLSNQLYLHSVFFSGISRGCHKSFPSAFFAKWCLQAKGTSTHVWKVSFCFTPITCTFWIHQTRLALQPPRLLLLDHFFGEEREREMSETCPVLPSCVWDLAHPPQSKGLITTVLGLREATLEIKYFWTLRGGVLCLPTSNGFWFVWFLTSGKLLCDRVLGRQLTFSERVWLYLLLLLAHRWLYAISMVNRLSQCAEMCAVQIYHHLCVDWDPAL